VIAMATEAVNVTEIGLEESSYPGPPDWSRVPFEVSCARCGHELRGLAEPACPGCGLEFDWGDAVPVEHLTCDACGYHLYGLENARCPECGKAFDWEDALATYHRKRLPYFEYRWRDRPVRSFLRTWRMVLRPWKFWKNINLHDPPRPGPLIVMLCACIVLTPCTLVAVIVSDSIGGALAELFNPGVLSQTTAVDFWSLVTWEFRRATYLLCSRTLWKFTGCVLLWATTSLAALLMFQQSMVRCRIRSVHVIRVWAYATPFGLPTCLIFSYISLLALRLIVIDPMYILRRDVVILGFLWGWLHAVWATYCGYRSYLRMPHAFAVALCAQLIAVLLAISIALLPFVISSNQNM